MANAVLDLVGTPSLVATGTNKLVVGTSGSGSLVFLTNGVQTASLSSTSLSILKGESLHSDVTGASAAANTAAYLASDAAGGTFLTLIANQADALGSHLNLMKTRSTALDADTIVANADIVGRINFYGADGGNYSRCAMITGSIDNTPSSSSMPGMLKFWTTPDSSLTPLGRWWIDRVGALNQDATNGGSLFLSAPSTCVTQLGATGLTATGTTISDALQLTAVFNNVTTTAANTGVKLFEPNGGCLMVVRNGGANALKVYPPNSSGSINGDTAGDAVSVAAGAFATLIRVATNTWISIVGAASTAT